MTVGKPYVAPIPPALPDPPELGSNMNEVISFLPKLSAALVTAFAGTIPLHSPVTELILSSPSGKVYSVTISDTGVLTTTLVHDPP